MFPRPKITPSVVIFPRAKNLGKYDDFSSNFWWREHDVAVSLLPSVADHAFILCISDFACSTCTVPVVMVGNAVS